MAALQIPGPAHVLPNSTLVAGNLKPAMALLLLLMLLLIMMLLLLLLRLLLSLFFSCCCCGYLSSRCVSRSTTIALHFNRKKRCCYFSGNAALTVQSVADSATAIAVSLSVAVAFLVQASSEKAPRSLKKPWEQIVAVTVDVTADAAVSVAVDVAFAFAVAVAVAVTDTL